MTVRNVTGAYPTCPVLSSTNHQCSFSPCSLLNMSLSHCRISISFPTGLSWFFVYAWVAMSGVPADISVLSYVLPSPSSSITAPVSSVLLLPAVSSLSWLTPVVVSLLPVSAPLSSNSKPLQLQLSKLACCTKFSSRWNKHAPTQTGILGQSSQQRISFACFAPTPLDEWPRH